MAKFQSPLLGYNNNVRHKNRVFHIQTEDSGVNRPHIITHLFMDGGRILKSVKTSYAEHVGSEGMNETVKLMMKEQHKAMFIALRDGQFDHIVEGAEKPSSTKDAGTSPASASAPKSAGTAGVKPAGPASGAMKAASTAAVAPGAPPVPAAPPPAPAAAAHAPAEPPAEIRKPSLPRVPTNPTPPPPAVTASRMTTREIEAAPPVPSAPKVISDDDDDSFPLTRPKSAPSMPAAVAAPPAKPAERSAAASLGDSAPYASHDLPPPHKNAFVAKEPGTGGGAYRAIAATERMERTDRTTSAPTKTPPPTPPKPPEPAVVRPAGEGRYAPSRPSSIFDSVSRPPPQSIFSDELISDKSLDEVILSYLAEDLEPPRRK